MEWIRGETIGRGSFGTVSLAIPKTELPQIPIVVKSSEVSNSNSLRNEKEVLSELGNSHPNIVQMLGDSLTSEKGNEVYNLFLEYAGAGSLADQLRISAGGKFEFSDAKRYARSILKGLDYIHKRGFVHCDIKLQNILLFNDGAAKIADFGLAKRAEEKTGFQLRGTPLYMSPEIVAGGEGESPADVWAFGCAVVEMVTGNPAWKCSPECDVSGLLYRIGVAGECPEIPEELCPEGKDFLRKCFVKDPSERWTAQMLLDHPFLSGFEDSVFKPASVSPRCPFEFPDWESSTEESSSGSGSDSFGSLDSFEFPDESESESDCSCWSSISSRFEEELVGSDQVMPDWSIADGWVSVR